MTSAATCGTLVRAHMDIDVDEAAIGHAGLVRKDALAVGESADGFA